jgi:hypothetical protein
LCCLRWGSLVVLIFLVCLPSCTALPTF